MKDAIYSSQEMITLLLMTLIHLLAVSALIVRTCFNTPGLPLLFPEDVIFNSNVVEYIYMRNIFSATLQYEPFSADLKGFHQFYLLFWRLSLSLFSSSGCGPAGIDVVEAVTQPE